MNGPTEIWPDPAGLSVEQLNRYMESAYLLFSVSPREIRRESWDRVLRYKRELDARKTPRPQGRQTAAALSAVKPQVNAR